MIRALLVAALLFPTLALAEQPQQPDPSIQALGQMVVEAAQREAQVRAQLIAAQAKIAALEVAKPTTPDPAAKIAPVPNATLPAPSGN